MPERLIILWPNRLDFQTNKKFNYTNRFKYKFLSSSSVGLVENNIFDKFESSIAFIRGIKAKQLGVFISLNHYILGKALFECCQSYKRYTHQIESKLVHFSHKIEFINNCRRTEKNLSLNIGCEPNKFVASFGQHFKQLKIEHLQWRVFSNHLHLASIFCLGILIASFNLSNIRWTCIPFNLISFK